MANPATLRTGMILPHQSTPTAAFNRCNLSPWALASEAFQAAPRAVEILGVRQEDSAFFDSLAGLASAEQRGTIFHDYVAEKFWNHDREDASAGTGRRAPYTYLKVLQGWAADSNGHAGAVLKGWVESRFGIRVTYHQGCLATDLEALNRYVDDPKRGLAQLLGIGQQLDLLYTFCQEELRRRYPDLTCLTLYRGTHDPDEYAVKEAIPRADRRPLVEFNGVSSFTGDREVAWEFGSAVWSVQVPLPKIICFSGLLPRHMLDGEQEFLVLGGDYRVEPLRC